MTESDYKSLYRSLKTENIRLHNQNYELRNEMAFLLNIKGVKNLVKKEVERLKHEENKKD